MQRYRENAKKKQRRGSHVMKITSFVLALFLVLESAFGQSGAVVAHAEEEIAGALAEETIEVYTEEDFDAEPEDVLEVQTADGEAEIDGVVWKYELTSGNVEIIQGSDFGSSTEIKIPSKIDGNSVTSIGGGAFAWCRELTSITIPSSVTSIESFAFQGCIGLSSITIPSSVTSIGSGAFAHCSGLTSITIPNSVTSIGKEAFNVCYSLTSITIPKGVTSIGEYAFGHCSALTSITIPNSVTSIGNSAFYYCSALTSITIPNSVTSIEGYTFDYCSALTSITIPKSVTSIKIYAFEGCDELKIVRYTGSESEWNKIEITDVGNNILGCVRYIYNYVIPQEADPAPSSPQPGEGEVSPTPTVQPTPAADENVVPGASKIGGEWISAKQAQVKITKVTPLKKSFKLTWKKVSSVKGYQVQYALDKKFKKSAKIKTVSKAKTTSIKIKGLKAKTKYYVRMRTFTTTKLNGKTVKVYSKWSKAKTVKTK